MDDEVFLLEMAFILTYVIFIYSGIFACFAIAISSPDGARLTANIFLRQKWLSLFSVAAQIFENLMTYLLGVNYGKPGVLRFLNGYNLGYFLVLACIYPTIALSLQWVFDFAIPRLGNVPVSIPGAVGINNNTKLKRLLAVLVVLACALLFMGIYTAFCRARRSLVFPCLVFFFGAMAASYAIYRTGAVSNSISLSLFVSFCILTLLPGNSSRLFTVYIVTFIAACFVSIFLSSIYMYGLGFIDWPQTFRCHIFTMDFGVISRRVTPECEALFAEREWYVALTKLIGSTIIFVSIMLARASMQFTRSLGAAIFVVTIGASLLGVAYCSFDECRLQDRNFLFGPIFLVLLLPIANALADWLSLAWTRYCLSRAGTEGVYSTPKWFGFDLAGALAAFLVIGVFIVLGGMISSIFFFNPIDQSASFLFGLSESTIMSNAWVAMARATTFLPSAVVYLLVAFVFILDFALPEVISETVGNMILQNESNAAALWLIAGGVSIYLTAVLAVFLLPVVIALRVTF